jgi:hypothetical protein
MSRNRDPFASVLGMGRGVMARLPSGRSAQLDSRWDETLDARCGPSGRAPLPPNAGKLETYAWDHAGHPGLRAVSDTPHPGWVLISCSHTNEVGEDVLTPIADARHVLARYGVELVPRKVPDASRRAKRTQ